MIAYGRPFEFIERLLRCSGSRPRMVSRRQDLNGIRLRRKMHTRIDRALADVQQAQDNLLIQLRSFLTSPGREAAAHLDCAIEDQATAAERVAGARLDYLAKQNR